MIAGVRPDRPDQPEQSDQVAALVRELALLRSQVDRKEESDGTDVLLNRFLAETETYADTVVDTVEWDHPEGASDPPGARRQAKEEEREDASARAARRRDWAAEKQADQRRYTEQHERAEESKWQPKQSEGFPRPAIVVIMLPDDQSLM